MPDIKLSDRQRGDLLDQIKRYMESELDTEIGSFEAGFLLDFILEIAGPAIYNQAIYDAQALISAQMERISDDLLSLEKS